MKLEIGSVPRPASYAFFCLAHKVVFVASNRILSKELLTRNESMAILCVYIGGMKYDY